MDQRGTFTRDQAHAAGVTESQLRHRVRSGVLVQIGPNAFRGPLVPVTALVELTGLVLDVGEPVWVCGPTAAALHGFDGFVLGAPFHLMIPRGRHVVRRRARIRTSAPLTPIDRARLSGLPATAGARTMIDLARTEDLERLTLALDAGLRDGRFNEDHLHRRILALRGKGRHGIPTLLAAIEGLDVRRGGHSYLERAFLELIAEAGLPRPLTQQVLARTADRIVRVDVRFPGTPVVVELLGYRYHRSVDALRRDAERLNALIGQGFQPYQFTYDQVVEDGDATVDVVRRALGRA